MIPPTPRQAALLRFIEAYTREHGSAPCFREMEAALGVASKCTVHRLLTGLEERGHVRRLYNRVRAIELLHPAPPATVMIRGERFRFIAVAA